MANRQAQLNALNQQALELAGVSIWDLIAGVIEENEDLIVEQVNLLVNIPIIPERVEALLLRAIVAGVGDALTKIGD